MEKRTILQKVYVTADGKIFSDKWEAENHEERLELEQLEQKFHKIPHVPSAGLEKLFGTMGVECNEASWYHFRGQEDVETAGKLWLRSPDAPGDYLFLYAGDQAEFIGREEMEELIGRIRQEMAGRQSDGCADS